MNGDNPTVEAQASVGAQAFPPSYTYTPPVWPPPSGGAPVTQVEQSPKMGASYGSAQTPTINAKPPNPPAGYPPPFGSLPGTTYPMARGAAKNGQNQGPSNQLPPRSRPLEIGPIAASPAISQIKPPPIMGPAPQNITTAIWEMGPIAGTPPPGRTFPAGSAIDGFSSTPL